MDFLWLNVGHRAGMQADALGSELIRLFVRNVSSLRGEKCVGTLVFQRSSYLVPDCDFDRMESREPRHEGGKSWPCSYHKRKKLNIDPSLEPTPNKIGTEEKSVFGAPRSFCINLFNSLMTSCSHIIVLCPIFYTRVYAERKNLLINKDVFILIIFKDHIPKRINVEWWSFRTYQL